jgi:hypothetical protein
MSVPLSQLQIPAPHASIFVRSAICGRVSNSLSSCFLVLGPTLALYEIHARRRAKVADGWRKKLARPNPCLTVSPRPMYKIPVLDHASVCLCALVMSERRIRCVTCSNRGDSGCCPLPLQCFYRSECDVWRQHHTFRNHPSRGSSNVGRSCIGDRTRSGRHVQHPQFSGGRFRYMWRKDKDGFGCHQRSAIWHRRNSLCLVTCCLYSDSYGKQPYWDRCNNAGTIYLSKFHLSWNPTQHGC